MKRALVLVGLVVMACDQRPENCATPMLDPGAPPVEISALNQPVTLELLGLLEVVCERNGPAATEVVVTVRDAHDALVDEVHTALQPRSIGFATEVTFTPVTPGTYVLEANFGAGVKPARRQHLVVADRSAEQPELISTLGKRCEAIHPFGTSLFCRTARDGVEVWADGGVVETLPAWPLETDDGVAWLFLGSSVMRLEAVDGGIRRDSMTLPFHPASGMSADHHKLVQISLNAVHEIFFADGVLHHSERAVTKGYESYPRVVVWAGPQFAFASESQLCLLAATSSSVGCRIVHSSRWRGERGVVWFRRSVTELEQFRVYAEGTTELRALPKAPALVEATQDWPLFSWNQRFVTVRPDDLSLEVWPKLNDVATVTITPSHVTFQTVTNRVVVYRR